MAMRGGEGSGVGEMRTDEEREQGRGPGAKRRTKRAHNQDGRKRDARGREAKLRDWRERQDSVTGTHGEPGSQCHL